jgi:hypothetical protein
MFLVPNVVREQRCEFHTAFGEVVPDRGRHVLSEWAMELV